MTPRPAASRFLVALASLAFVSLGLPDGLLGVAWPSMRASFGLPLDALGALLVAVTSGYVASSFATGFLLARMRLGMLLALSVLLTSASLLGFAGAPAFWMLLPLAVVAGLGAGAIDSGINAYASQHLGPRLMNWLHACFGIGAASGPLVMTAVLQAAWPWTRGYLLVGLAQLLLAAAFYVTAPAWSDGGSPRPGPADGRPADSPPAPRRSRQAWLGVATFFVYTGLEAGFGLWSYTLFTEGRGVSPAVAGACVSAFWGGLTAGRLLGAFVLGRLPVPLVLRGCLVVIAAAAALLAADVADAASFAAVAVAGVACGPVFPSLMSTTSARIAREHLAGVVGYQVAAAALGAALVPAAMGVVAGRTGLESVGTMLLLLAVAVLAVQETLLAPVRATRPVLGGGSAG